MGVEECYGPYNYIVLFGETFKENIDIYFLFWNIYVL